jgi:DNA adenine methylase
MQPIALTNKNAMPRNAINVAAIPMRSPFRYPGGKTWLIPYVRLWLKSRRAETKRLLEPFAGGGIVSLTAVFEKLVKGATMVERDEDVAAAWQIILSKDANWLADRITSFEVTEESVKAIFEKKAVSTRERAFAAILKNRVHHGGILAPGAGLLKYGENGKGVLSRWYPQTLKKRILAISLVKDRIDFIEGDGLKVMAENTNRKDVMFFIDPPYIKAGKRLYKYSAIDHEALFELTARCAGDFLMTYDDASEIRALAKCFCFEVKTVTMKSTHHEKKMELLIGRNLNWLQSFV